MLQNAGVSGQLSVISWPQTVAQEHERGGDWPPRFNLVCDLWEQYAPEDRNYMQNAGEIFDTGNEGASRGGRQERAARTSR